MGYLLRLTLLLIIGWLVWRFLSRALSDDSKSPPAKRQSSASADMVACVHCGLHIPRDEALYRDGKPYCSREHLEAGPG
jgi:uncharacterized protein